ncbi:DUF1707 SHOCT-like domain-containing protein [Microlunatus speluncae]|uniref:DUF1707 SHOCT-like domain-containing protein n=1 Tax=Microlunatus speluncae TaxID=2594267 RepID=UPI001375466A|nr:DUF1707 domain-containing protein [Microlunatus speluncae]
MTEPVPAPRIGDSERDQATEYLREHLAQGRLDQAEFDERMTAALVARTQPELDKLFADLPAPRPGRELAVPDPARPAAVEPAGLPHSPRLINTIGIVTAVIWPVTLLLLFAIGWHNWFLIFIPIAVSALFANLQKQSDDHRKHLDREERRRLEGKRDDDPES